MFSFANWAAFERWFYEQLFDGPLCVLVGDEVITIGVQPGAEIEG